MGLEDVSPPLHVMAGLDPAIQSCTTRELNLYTWIAASSAAME
jgi:hypothetical protein